LPAGRSDPVTQKSGSTSQMGNCLIGSDWTTCKYKVQRKKLRVGSTRFEDVRLSPRPARHSLANSKKVGKMTSGAEWRTKQ